MDDFPLSYKVPKLPSEMTEADCRRCNATGLIHVPSGCFGSKSVRCEDCLGKGIFTPEMLQAKKALEDLKRVAAEGRWHDQRYPIRLGEIVQLFRGFAYTNQKFRVVEARVLEDGTTQLLLEDSDV